MARNILLNYASFNRKTEIHIDAIHFQLGLVIVQEVKPIVFGGRKLSGPQTRYTTT